MKSVKVVFAMIFILNSAGGTLAATFTVAGVVSDSNLERKGGVSVGLYFTKTGQGRKAVDRTSTHGVYNLVNANVVGSFNVSDLAVWVLYEGEEYVADPQKVELESSGGVIRGKAGDIQLISRSKAIYANGTDEAAERIAAFANTQSVKVQAGELSMEKAEQIIRNEALQVAAMTKGVTGDPAGITAGLEKLLPKVTERLNTDMPKIGVFTNDKFIGLKDDANFKATMEKSKSFDPSRYLGDSSLRIPDNVLESLRALAPSDIDPAWLEGNVNAALVKKYLEEQRSTGGKGSMTVIDIRKRTPNSAALPTEKVNDIDAVNQWLRASPEARKWLLDQNLLEHPGISEKKRREMKRGSPNIRPAIIAPPR